MQRGYIQGKGATMNATHPIHHASGKPDYRYAITREEAEAYNV